MARTYDDEVSAGFDVVDWFDPADLPAVRFCIFRWWVVMSIIPPYFQTHRGWWRAGTAEWQCGRRQQTAGPPTG